MTITRDEILHRARTRWGGIGVVPYSQSTLTRTGYRADCSGLVCDALGIPPAALGSWGGLNTVTLVSSGYVSRIDPDDLRPGDLVGNMGPGTGGDAGHVQIFTDWLNSDDGDSRYRCIEQRGGASGPRDRDRVYDMARNGYRAYRYRDIIDTARGSATMTPEQETELVRNAHNSDWGVTQILQGTDPAAGFSQMGGGTFVVPNKLHQKLDGIQAAVDGIQAGGQPTDAQVDAAVLKALQDPNVLKGIGDAIAAHLHVT